jgi:DNA-binding CsgD family transcriptional regulator
MTPDRLSELIGSIYDCVIAPDCWAPTLDQIRQELGFHNSVLSVHTLPFAKSWARVNVGVDPYFVERVNHYTTEIADMWGGPQRVISYPLEEPIIQSEVTPRETWARNPYYREWIQPQGLYDCVAITLAREPTLMSALAFGVHEQHGPITNAQMEALRLLAPHLRRAVVIGRHFDHEATAASTFAAAIDALSAGVILLDEKMSAVYVNPLARDMLANQDFIYIRNGELTLSQTVPNELLRKGVSQAASKESDIDRRSIAIPIRRGDNSPTVVQVLPLNAGALRPHVAQSAVAAVFISRAADAPQIPADTLSILYNFTPAETRVVELIVSGKAPADIADHLGISLATVRTHLARVFEKTGCSRQAELVAMVSKIVLPV